MTITADTAARTSENGHQCPPWCVVDHASARNSLHSSKTTWISLGDLANVRTRVAQLPYDGDAPEILVAGSAGDGTSDATVWLKPDIAVKVACLVDALGRGTPEQHRAFAAAIRRAAAQAQDA